MPSCEKGHEQGLWLKCQVCGSTVCFMDATEQFASLPKVEPDYGKASILYVGVPPARDVKGYRLVVSSGDAPKRTKDEYVLTNMKGGTWHDYYSRNGADLSRWLKVVAFGKSQLKLLFVDTTSPLAVLAIASLPPEGQTAVVATFADPESTPMEKNTSYVAISAAVKHGLPVLAVPQSLVRQSTIVEGNGSALVQEDAVSLAVGGLLRQMDGLMDFLERDRHIGVLFHLLSPVLSGSLQIYGTASNVFSAQSYLLPREAKPEDASTFYSLVSCSRDLGGEFERGFSKFRNRRMKATLAAEFKFEEEGTSPQSFDLFAIYGFSEPNILQGQLQEGYSTVSKRAPVLDAGSVA